MRLAPLLVVSLVGLGLAACQRHDERSDVSLTSGPAPETPVAVDAASEATEADAISPRDDEAEPAQQSAPPASDTGDMGEARSRQESVEPDSPTMFQ